MNHQKFEALAGAVMLGEASSEDRAVFEAHASSCEECRLDAACAPVLVQSIDAARGAETWRPAVDRAVLARIRDSRSSRFKMTIGAFGWAVALSLVLNVAFASGLSTRMFSAFEERGDGPGDGTAMHFDLESPAPHVAVVAPVVVRHARVAFVKPQHVRRPAVSPVVAAVPRVRASASRDGDVPAGDVPDVLAGIDIDGTGDRARHVAHVAVQPRPCDPAAVATPRTDDALVDAQAAAPCPVTSADPLR